MRIAGERAGYAARAVAGAMAVVLLGVGIVALAYAYVTYERFFYSWDWAGFHSSAAIFAEVLKKDPWIAFGLFRDSMKGEYNLVYVLPLIPVLAVTQGERAAYVAAVAGLYLVPFALLIGVACRRAFPTLGRVALWSGTVLAVATPPVWLSVMRGYP